jgi:glutamine amidotransferase
MTEVTIVDYGLGNILSLQRAFEYCGASVQLAQTTQKIRDAKRLVLPGVGAFPHAMEKLRILGFLNSIREVGHSGVPFLGICVGMQMLFTQSEEFGLHKGLGLISGRVVPIPPSKLNGEPHKIPHINWSPLLLCSNSSTWPTSILNNIPIGSSAYFIHSFMGVPDSVENCFAVTKYNGIEIPAVIGNGKLLGCQFHPEKSGPIGLSMIKNFLKL